MDDDLTVDMLKIDDPPRFFYLDGHDPVPTCLWYWGYWFGNHDRHVNESRLKYGDEICRISTVFLGLDHGFSFGKGSPPVLFETMIFGGPLDQQYQDRCCTWKQAKEMHYIAGKEAVKNGYRSW
jgi:hypothetical protein